MPMERLQAYQNDFTPKELAVYKSIVEFKSEEDDLVDKLRAAVETPFDEFAERVEGTNAGDLLDRAVQTTVDRMEDVSSWSIDRQEAYDDFRQLGHDIDGVEDVRDLEIEIVESVVQDLDKKYSKTAFAQGAATGVAGLPGALADIPLVLTMALRAINEYATRYGYDVEQAPEQGFAMLILAAAASSSRDERQESLDKITDRSRELAPSNTATRVEAQEPVASQIAESVVLRLARGMLAESIPVVGALVSGGMNTAFLNQVCETAHHAYQERWLVDRYVA